MPDIDISINGILKLLNNLKPGKAASLDSKRPILLNELRVELAPIIKVIFERSLQTGKLPADWCKANVTPIFKKGDKSLAANSSPRNASKGKQTDLILLDFSKAFDKVSHSKLIWKLQNYRIRSNVLNWIGTFFGDRSQRVVVAGEGSDCPSDL